VLAKRGWKSAKAEVTGTRPAKWWVKFEVLNTVNLVNISERIGFNSVFIVRKRKGPIALTLKNP